MCIIILKIKMLVGFDCTHLNSPLVLENQNVNISYQCVLSSWNLQFVLSSCNYKTNLSSQLNRHWTCNATRDVSKYHRRGQAVWVELAMVQKSTIMATFICCINTENIIILISEGTKRLYLITYQYCFALYLK